MGANSLVSEAALPDVRTHDVTALLLDWRGGDAGAVEKLLPLVHGELRRIAKRHMAGERPDHLLQPTSERRRSWSSRFFGGLSVEETAEVLKVSQETVVRDWKFAKNWLMRERSRGVKQGSDRGQTGVRPGSDQGQTP